MTHNRPEMSVLFLINSQQTRGVCNISLNDSQQTTGVCPISHQLTADQICLFHFASTLNEPEMSVLSLSLNNSPDKLSRPEMAILFFDDPQETGDVYLTVVTGICVHSNSISKCYFVPTLHTCLFCPPCWEWKGQRQNEKKWAHSYKLQMSAKYSALQNMW